MSSSNIEAMHARIKECLSDTFIKRAVWVDFSKTFQNIGMDKQSADRLTTGVLVALTEELPLQDTELQIYKQLSQTTVRGAEALTTSIDYGLRNRAEIIYRQVRTHLSGVNGKIIDYGTGYGKVAQLLSNNGMTIVGADVCSYKDPTVTIPVEIFNGTRINVDDCEFKAGLATNVFHHEADNEKCLIELSRIVKSKLVIIETVPVGSTHDEIERDRGRTFMNDYLYNRLLHDPKIDVPVPGTYETPEGWVERIQKHGWQLKHSEDLGVDLPVIADTHHLLVFER